MFGNSGTRRADWRVFRDLFGGLIDRLALTARVANEAGDG